MILIKFAFSFDEYLKAEQKNDSAAPASDSREEF